VALVHPPGIIVAITLMRRCVTPKSTPWRRTQEGKSKREIIRCLKRYVAREVYRVLVPAASPIRP
jgi:transposase